MSPLRRILKGRVGLTLLIAMIAWSLSRPMLFASGMMAQEGMAVLYAILAAVLLLLVSLVPKSWSFLPPLLVIGGVVFSALSIPGSLPSRGLFAIQAFVSGVPAHDVVLLYQDALLPLLMLVLALFALLLTLGDPAFSLPLLLSPLLMLWFSGVRAPLSLYLPAMLCLPLLYGAMGETGAGAAPAPQKWRGLRTLAVALAIALLAMVLSPSTPQTQPQAAQMAGDLRRAIEDYFFFTRTRNSFTLASQGFQPMGSDGLGGSPNISTTPVMEVTAGENVYLRGTAQDLYNGRAWFDTLSHERYSWLSMRFSALRTELFNELLPRTNRLEQKSVQVQMLTDLPSTLFVPQRVRELSPGEGLVPYFNSSTEVFVTRDLAPGDSYAIRYEPYIAGQSRTDALVNLLAQAGDNQLPSLDNAYYQLPDHLKGDGPVANLARQVAGQVGTPYQQGMALMRYLKANYQYTLDVPEAPGDLDFVSHFLFYQQTGYCTYFASAMTVMARSLGLPARYVEGFLAKPGAEGITTLTGENGHAWTEIYIAGIGWVVFDATPGEGEQHDGPPPPGQQPSPPPPEPSEEPTKSPEPSPETTQEPSPEPQQTPSPSPPPEPEPPTPSPQPSPEPHAEQDPQSPPGPPFPWWLLLLALLALAFAFGIRAGQPKSRAQKLQQADQVMLLYWQALLQANQHRGWGMGSQETSLSYAKRLVEEDRLSKEQAQGLLQLAQAHSALVYGRVQPQQGAEKLAQTQYQQAFDSLSMLQKGSLQVSFGVQYIKDVLRFMPAQITVWLKTKLSLAGAIKSGRRPRNKGKWR